VVAVSWFEASAYAAWAGARLPTEAEWERAARGLLSCRFPWGDQPPPDGQRGNYDSGSEAPGAPTPVGLYPLGNSSEGVSDLPGNVHEWTADWYDARCYESSPGRDPAGPSDGWGGVLRGGCWDYERGSVRVSARDWYEPTIRYREVGFRCGGEIR
jgi:sulfatase modifying factor 1